MNAVVGLDWLDQHVLRDIREMLVHDAYFKLMGYGASLPAHSTVRSRG